MRVYSDHQNESVNARRIRSEATSLFMSWFDYGRTNPAHAYNDTQFKAPIYSRSRARVIDSNFGSAAAWEVNMT